MSDISGRTTADLVRDEHRILLAPVTYSRVHDERIRAHRKHAEAGSMELLPWDHPRWLPVLVEEVGEVARELCERDLGTYNEEDAATFGAMLREALVQVAAMACAWIDAIDEERGQGEAP